MNNAAAAEPLHISATVPANAGAAIPCVDYFPKTATIAHVNYNPKWWDTTTMPLPWTNVPPAPALPTYPLPNISITTSGGNYTSPTQAAKAEIVLAVLLNVLTGKSYVELMNRVVPDGELESIEFVYQGTGLLIRVPKKMRYSEIVNALYEEFGNLRGKEIR